MIAADAELLPLARAVAADVADLDGLPWADLKGAELIVIIGSKAWERVRAWRAAGVSVGVVVVGSPAPEDRPRLEPVVALPAADAAALRQARERLAVAELPAIVSLAGGVVDLHRGVFRRADGAEERLTGLETRLLAYLCARPGRPIGQEELQEQVWEHRKALETRAVEVAVMRLRRKLEVDPGKPVSLLTARGEGYRVALAASPSEPAPFRSTLRGRSALVASSVAELDHGGVTALVGPAGVGKSTVLRELARSRPSVVVDLDGAPPDPWTALAVALDVAVPARGPAAPAVIAALAGRSLLCLDHADEHLTALADVAASLGAAGVAVALATRRLPAWVGLRIREVPPLELPDALGLLEERSGVTGPEVAEIADRLDRLPLALELVAARLAAVGPEVLLQALRQRGSLWLRAAGHRHATVRDAIAWSVARAPEPLVAVLARLSAFPGTFDGPLAAEVAGATPFDLLALVEDGLVARTDRRFRLLHAVREYAAELSPDLAAAARAPYVAAIAARARPATRDLERRSPRTAMESLRALVPDLRHVLEAAPPDADPDRFDCVFALERVLAAHGTPDERRALLDAWLPTADPRQQAQLGLRLAVVDFAGDRDAALARLDAEAARISALDPRLGAQLALQAATYAFTLHDPRDVLGRLTALDPNDMEPVDRSRAEALSLRCRAKLGELSADDQVHRIVGLAAQLLEEGYLPRATEASLRLADVLLGEDPARADVVLKPVGDRADALIDTAMRCSVLVCQAQAAGECGRTEEALDLLERAEAAVTYTAPMWRWLVAHQRGRVLLAAGRPDEAREAFSACLAWWRAHGWPSGAYDQLEQLALVDLDAGRAPAAARWADEALATARELDNEAGVAEASTWAAAAAVLAGEAELARRALEAASPDPLSAGPRLVFYACCAVVDGDHRARAEAQRLLARLPEALPARRVAVRILADRG